MFPKNRYRGKSYRRLEVRVSQSGVWGIAPSLTKLNDMFSGNIYQRKEEPKRKPIWMWRDTQGGAYDFLTAIRPYLVEKDTQATIAMLAYEQKRGVHEGGIADRFQALIRAERNGTTIDHEMNLIDLPSTSQYARE